MWNTRQRGDVPEIPSLAAKTAEKFILITSFTVRTRGRFIHLKKI
jgi:hypothetical protein